MSNFKLSASLSVCHFVSKYVFELLTQLTSPPSAREAAMSAMQHVTFLKHLESFLKTSLKHP